MATTQNTYTGDGSTTDYTLTFPYLAVADVRVSLNNIGTTAFSLLNATTLRFTTAPGSGVAIRIYRVTDDANNKIVFNSGSTIKADDLNDAVNRNLYIAQETTNNVSNVTAGQVSDGSLTTSKLADAAVTTAKIASSAITTVKISDANVTTSKIASANVTTDKIADANVTTAKIADDAVTTAKILNSNVTTAKVADSNITTAKIADDAVTAAKLANTNVSAGSYTYSNLTVDDQGRLTAASSAVSPLFQSYAVICDQKTQGTNGGTFTNGDWRTRDLNTEIFDPDNIVSIANNEFSLGAGTYFVEAHAPAFGVNANQVRLYNVTASSVVQLGPNAYARNATGDVGTSSAKVFARVTISGTTAFQIQHRCLTTRSTTGFGVDGNWGPEIYTTVKIYKEI